MSTGPRINITTALNATEILAREWKMTFPVCEVVGSARRGRLDVGDLDFLAPLPADPKKDDPLYLAILATCVDQPQPLFGEQRPQFTRVVKGFKPGFLCADVIVKLRIAGAEVELPIQINRYTPENRGWKQIECTGPREFGIWFLQEWKRQYGIQSGPASVDGHLVDSYLKRVPVADEHECFLKIRHEFIPPEQRDGFALARMDSRARAEREAWR